MDLIISVWDKVMWFMRELEPNPECPICGYLIDPVDGCRCEKEGDEL